jgi:hypothetical protein
MQTFRFHFSTYQVSFAFAALLCVLAGCLRSVENSEPFDNESLRLLGVSAKHELHLYESHKEYDLTEQQTNNLVAALCPIKSAKIGKLPPDEINYILSFQPGRNPVIFHVHLADDHLMYAERQYLYEGGNAEAFKKVVDSITAVNSGKPGDLIDHSGK